MFQGDGLGDDFLGGDVTGFQGLDDLLEVLGGGVSGAAYVEFFFYELSGVVGDVDFGVADVDDASGVGDGVDGGGEGLRGADGFYDDVCAEILGEGVELIEEGGFGCVDEFGCAYGFRDLEFVVVEVGGDDACALCGCACDYAESDCAAAEDEDGVGFGDLSAFDCVEAYCEGFDEGGLGVGEALCGDEFLPGLGDEFCEGAFALHAEGGVVFAGVVPFIFAGGAFAAV